MGYETLTEFMNSPEAAYAAVGFAGAFAGYIAARFFGNRAITLGEQETERVLATEKTKQLHAQIELGKNDHLLELKRLEYEEIEKQHQRNTTRDEKNMQYKLDLASKLVELKPVIEKYLLDLKQAQTNSPINQEYLQKRQERRKELVKGILDYYDNNQDGWEYAIAVEGEEIFDKTTIEQINAIVDIEIPLGQPTISPIPIEIKKLVELLSE